MTYSPRRSTLVASQTDSASDIDYHVVSWDSETNQRLLKEYHKLRKIAFVDDLGWDVPHYDGYEYDQYDGPRATYILSARDGKCIGGCRVMRTDGRQLIGTTSYSYMLRDAQKGLLPGIPADMCDTELPSDRDAWELTRVVSDKNPVHLRDLTLTTVKHLRNQNAESCHLISRPAVYQLGKMWGLSMEKVGSPRAIGNSKWLVAKCNIRQGVNLDYMD